MEVSLLLCKHGFAQALVKARALNVNVPDDTLFYALLADAVIKVGQYEEAEKAVQWSFDILRAPTSPAFHRSGKWENESCITLVMGIWLHDYFYARPDTPENI